MKRALFVVMIAACLVAPTALAAQPPQVPPGQEEFVPLDQIPPEEQIPAFTLVAAAYALVWVLLIGYVWSVAKRLQKVEQEVSTLTRRSAP